MSSDFSTGFYSNGYLSILFQLVFGKLFNVSRLQLGAWSWLCIRHRQLFGIYVRTKETVRVTFRS